MAMHNCVKIHRLADLRLNELQGCLGGGLRSPSASILAVIVFDRLLIANCNLTEILLGVLDSCTTDY